jgi:hypothetical protein
MATRLRELRILGIHPVHPSDEDLDEAVEVLWGSTLSGMKLEAARRNVEEHFGRPGDFCVQSHQESSR